MRGWSGNAIDRDVPVRVVSFFCDWCGSFGCHMLVKELCWSGSEDCVGKKNVTVSTKGRGGSLHAVTHF